MTNRGIIIHARREATLKWVLVLMMVVGCGAGASTSARNTLDSIPSAAADAVRRAAGGAAIEKVERDGEVYEASWHVGGLEHEVRVTARGAVVEREEEVASVDVPAAVRAAAVVKLANAQSIKFVKLMSGNYEAEAIVEGREHEAVFAPDGRPLTDEDDDGDDHDDGEDDD